MLTNAGLAIIGIALVWLAYSGAVAVSAPYLPLFLLFIFTSCWAFFELKDDLFEIQADDRAQKGVLVIFSTMILLVLVAVVGPIFIDFMAQDFGSDRLDLTSSLLLYMFPAFFAMVLVYLLLKIGPSNTGGGRR